MSLQKLRVKSQGLKELSLFPVIAKKTLLVPDKKNEGQSMSGHPESMLWLKIEGNLQKTSRQTFLHVPGPKRTIFTQRKELEPLLKRQQQANKAQESLNRYKSTPKLSSISTQKRLKFRQPADRYIGNERLSIQLGLPKSHNISVDSDESPVHRALLREDATQKTQPVVINLRKNENYARMVPENTKEAEKFIEKLSSGQRIEITQNTQTFPLMQNPPVKQDANYQRLKGEKYIKEKFVGQEAITKFYSRYKNIQKIRQFEKFKLEHNPLTTILTILETYNIPPKKMQLIKLKGQQAILDLKNCGLGSGISIKAIAEIIQKVDIFQQIDLSSNNITPDLTEYIIPNLFKMKNINLSYNKIGRKGVQLLTYMLWNEETDQDCELQRLNLESNNIHDGSFGNFFTHLSNMNALLVLNLSKNYLGNSCASKLKEFLLKDCYLTELYLHWCELGVKATKMIFEGLVKNVSLRVLDLSWNQIGLEGIGPLCKFLKHNLTLLHLDISYCEIDEPDTKKISNSLKSNHTLYGLHYQGNHGYIDFKGHLHPISKQHQQIPLSIRAGLLNRIDSVNMIQDYIGRQHNQGKRYRKDVCWICQGWQEKYFRVDKEDQNQKGCFLHLDFQRYAGVLMSDKGTYYELVRMCPPRQISLFYTKAIGKNKLIHFYNPNKVGEIQAQETKEPLHLFYIENKRFTNVKLEKLNKVGQPVYLSEIFDQVYETGIHCQPRSDQPRAEHLLIERPPRVKKPKPPRKKIEIKEPDLIKQIKVKDIPVEFESAFSKNVGQGDTYDTFLKRCVQFDFSHSKITKIVKDENQIKELKQILKQNYERFAKVYYYLANNNPSAAGVYSINDAKFQKFIDEQSYASKRVTKAIMRVKLVSCLAYTSSDTQIQCFYRPQFFQFLLRLAIQKWCTFPKKETQAEQDRQKQCSVTQAFSKILWTLRRYEYKADSQQWRQQNLTTYEVSIVIKSYTIVFEQLYERYAGLTQKNMNTKTKKKMLLEELKVMFISADIRKTKQTLKDLQICYRTVKKLEIEDGISDTGIQYVEFLEVFCRFTEHLFMKPIGSENNSLWERDVVKSAEIPLFLKIEKLLKQIYMKNYDIRSKKFDSLFKHGLFPEQVDVMMQYLRQKHQIRPNIPKTYHLPKARVNTFEQKKDKITLNFLIDLLAAKAAKIQEENRQRVRQMEEEKERLQREAQLEAEQEVQSDDHDDD